MDREEIIRRLAAAFGPHMTWVNGHPMVPSGDDARRSCSLTFVADDGYTSVRPLTYGEIADALTAHRGPA
jgi:hypothetical protein